MQLATFKSYLKSGLLQLWHIFPRLNLLDCVQIVGAIVARRFGLLGSFVPTSDPVVHSALTQAANRVGG